MKVHESARKHGVKPEDSIRAADWALWIEDLDEDSPARQLRLGFDTHGRLLETVVLVFDSGQELVIHAMKARPQMYELLRAASSVGDAHPIPKASDQVVDE